MMFDYRLPRKQHRSITPLWHLFILSSGGGTKIDTSLCIKFSDYISFCAWKNHSILCEIICFDFATATPKTLIKFSLFRFISEKCYRVQRSEFMIRNFWWQKRLGNWVCFYLITTPGIYCSTAISNCRYGWGVVRFLKYYKLWDVFCQQLLCTKMRNSNRIFFCSFFSFDAVFDESI